MRAELFGQVFDELIRQITLQSVEQGLLLLRVSQAGVAWAAAGVCCGCVGSWSVCWNATVWERAAPSVVDLLFVGVVRAAGLPGPAGMPYDRPLSRTFGGGERWLCCCAAL